VRTVRLRAETATRASFAPFGSVPPEENDGNPTSDLEFLWNDGAVNFIGHTLVELDVVDGWMRCELLNRHDTHTQTLMPMSGDAVVVVAPGDVDFSEPEHFETVRAFVMAQHSCVHLHRGTWHWGPYPLDAPSVRIFNVQGRGYADDNGIAWLARDHDTVFEVPSSRYPLKSEPPRAR
jgi:ureidoglycolate hydrolase